MEHDGRVVSTELVPSLSRLFLQLSLIKNALPHGANWKCVLYDSGSWDVATAVFLLAETVFRLMMRSRLPGTRNTLSRWQMRHNYRFLSYK